MHQRGIRTVGRTRRDVHADRYRPPVDETVSEQSSSQPVIAAS